MRKKHEACQLGKDSLLDLPKIRIHASVSLLPFLLVFFSPSKLITAAFDLSFNLAFTRQSKAYIFIYLYIYIVFFLHKSGWRASTEAEFQWG